MEKLIQILNELHPEVDFKFCESLVDDKILDSFDIITIISEVYEQFDVIIRAEYIVPDNFNSVKALWQLIQSLQDED